MSPNDFLVSKKQRLLMQHDPLRPKKQFSRAHHEGIIAAVQRVSQDHMNKLVDEQRRQCDRSRTNLREIGGFQRRMSQQEIPKGENELPIFPSIGIGDRGKFVSADRSARVGEQFPVQFAFDRTGIFRRHQFGAREIGFEKFIRDHKSAARIAIKQMMAARKSRNPSSAARLQTHIGKIEIALRLRVILDLNERKRLAMAAPLSQL